MRSNLAILAAILSIAGTLPYLVDTLKGKTHPNLVSWFTWTLLNAINTLAAWSSGATQTTIFCGASALTTTAVLIVGLKSGLKRYGTFDIICQLMALIGIIIWRLTNNPSLAVLINLGADFAGFLPTYRHARKSPHAETWQLFAIGICSSILTLLSIHSYTFIAVASPIYIGAANLAMTATILGMRKKHALQMRPIVDNA